MESRKSGMFQIPWKHAARQGWNIEKDASLFRNWAMHTGKYKPGIDNPDPKTWKANFRCALNSLPDVKELHNKSIKNGNNAFRVYLMLPSFKIPKKRKVIVCAGKYKPGIDNPDPKTWKANFRCALNSLPDVKELHNKSIKKGNDAFRVYLLLPSFKIPKKRKGISLVHFKKITHYRTTMDSKLLTPSESRFDCLKALSLPSTALLQAGKEEVTFHAQHRSATIVKEETYSEMQTAQDCSYYPSDIPRTDCGHPLEEFNGEILSVVTGHSS
ncbi:UNVERIFIED_CONTAM: hypothetical protein FKN15_033453 [Acipenser sinensis]